MNRFCAVCQRLCFCGLDHSNEDTQGEGGKCRFHCHDVKMASADRVEG